MYTCYGVISTDQLGDLQQSSKGFSLNYIHRSAHGGDGDADGETGTYKDIAKQEIESLKTKYPSVFSEPTYPVDRSNCPQQFQYELPLKDENLDPPKRKIYPLDNTELEELKN